ncbi:MAG: hypothetical protein HC809_14785 [Gammaproteobacteria bacterium]|nr:hypothetical protein [Gammaproteobacteria bacterium]
MPTLHLIHSPRSEGDTLGRCADVARGGDAIVFYGRGVFAAAGVLPPLPNVALFVIAADALELHVTPRLPERVSIIDDARFVELVVEYPRSIAWA